MGVEVREAMGRDGLIEHSECFHEIGSQWIPISNNKKYISKHLLDACAKNTPKEAREAV